MSDKIVVKNLRKTFGKREVLKDVNFSVKDGEFLSILGPSGCGKTTILRILMGLETQTSGEVFMVGNEISKLVPAARGMGIVFQNYALFENMTVIGNVEYALKKRKELKKDAREIAEKMLDIVGLSEHKNAVTDISVIGEDFFKNAVPLNGNFLHTEGIGVILFNVLLDKNRSVFGRFFTRTAHINVVGHNRNSLFNGCLGYSFRVNGSYGCWVVEN